MHTWAARIGTMTLLGLCMAATGCMGDGGERPEDWTLPGDVRDAAFDSAPGDVPGAKDVRDASGVQDTTDIRDASDVAPLDCTCAVEGATCKRVNQRAVCLVDGAKCDFDVHGAECRPECSGHDDCGEKQYCNVNDRCYPRRKCDRNHALCPTGYWCDSDQYPASTCRRSGGKSVDASCEKDWECESGQCYEGTCLRRCLAEEDCPSSGRACSPFNRLSESLGCYTKTEGYSDCNVSCPEDQLCTDDKCRPHACRQTAQCPEGDCILSPKGLAHEGLGQCTGKERLCNGWEFRIEDDDPFCRLAIDCENTYNMENFSCPEGYECVKGDVDPHGNREFIGTTWCSRRVTDGEWRPDG